jgi:hypothetical protein
MKKSSSYLKHVLIALQAFKTAVGPYLDETLLKNKQDQLRSIENAIRSFKQSHLKVPKELSPFRVKLRHEIRLINEANIANQEFLKILQSYLLPPIPLTPKKHKPHSDLPINEVTQVSEPEANLIAANQNSAQSLLSGLSEQNAFLKKDEITLSEIIQAKIIPPGTVILNEFKGKVYRGIITEDGKITMKGVNNATYPDPHSATQEITGLSMDGWQWWNVFINKWKLPLDELRVIYLKRNS